MTSQFSRSHLLPLIALATVVVVAMMAVSDAAARPLWLVPAGKKEFTISWGHGKILWIRASHLPAGSTVTLQCTAVCSPLHETLPVGKSGKVHSKVFKNLRLATGTRFFGEVTKPGYVGYHEDYRAKSGGVKGSTPLCMPPYGTQTPTRCTTKSPRAPTSLHTRVALTRATLSWQARPAKNGGFFLYLDGKRIPGETATTAYMYSSLRCGKTYKLGVAQHDALYNVSKTASKKALTVSCRPPKPSASQGQYNIGLSWSRAAGAKGYKTYLNGSYYGHTTSTNFNFSNLNCNTGYTVGVKSYNHSGTSPPAQVGTGTTSCPAPPTPSVSVGEGDSHTCNSSNCDCTSTACHYVSVSWANFGSGGHTVDCYDDHYSSNDLFWSYSVSGASGTSNNVCVFGWNGAHVWATVDGVRSTNTVTWGS
jgi:hypothetical protein